MAAMLTVADAMQDFTTRKLDCDMMLSPGFFCLSRSKLRNGTSSAEHVKDSTEI
ncbi:hypothetical protein [Sphingomonas sp. VDB2]|uniref:hypothetical protein n=1 Tax=Sphingomonas sp. VDB2 TaxID=3228751 RepID=UPI003A811106